MKVTQLPFYLPPSIPPVSSAHTLTHTHEKKRREEILLCILVVSTPPPPPPLPFSFQRQTFPSPPLSLSLWWWMRHIHGRVRSEGEKNPQHITTSDRAAKRKQTYGVRKNSKKFFKKRGRGDVSSPTVLPKAPRCRLSE